MEEKDETNEFEKIKLSLKELDKANLEILEQTRNIQTEIKVIQQRSLQYKREINETRRDYENIITKLELLRSRLLELSGYKVEISSLRSRFEELTAFLHAKKQENQRQLDCLKEDLARQRSESAIEYARKIEEKRQQVERELSNLRSDLAAQDEERAIREQEREHNEELENLRAHIAVEMEQEKDEAHNNCQSKVRGLKARIHELQGKLAAFRNSS